MTLSETLSTIALEIAAIKIDTENPFTWASGYRMPVYNDNRRLLGNADHRLLIAKGFQTLIEERSIPVEVVAGTATAGIPHATSLANQIGTPLIYVRPAAKKHGLGNQIEGILLKGQQVVVVEDVISTGGSALKAVEAVRDSGSIVDHCVCIFHYGFKEAEQSFSQSHCQLHSLLTFTELVAYAGKSGTLKKEQISLLNEWYQDPFSWGESHGFPRETP